jgi:hypothetical protein
MSDSRKTAKPQVVTGDVKVDLGGGATGTVGSSTETLERIMEIAAEIWATVRHSGVAADDDGGNNALMERLQGEHKDFAISYPIPFRWMVQAREYEPQALEKFLREHVKAMYKDRKEFMAAQGEYLVILYKIRRPRAGARQLARYREAVTKSLQEDDDKFTAAREQAEVEVKRLDEEVDADRRQRIVAYLRRLKAATAAGAAPAAGAAAPQYPVEEYYSRLQAARKAAEGGGADSS